MKKKATRRAAKATSRQSTLNFPTSPEADLVAESTAAVTSMKSGMKNRTKRTEDVADKGSESLGDSSAISAIKTPRLRQTHSKSSDPMEQNEIALDKKRSGAELGQEFQNTLINHVAKADGELPRSWTRALLGEMVDIKYGKNLPTSAFTEHGYPVFGANGIIGNYDRYLYNEPQVLISCRGAYSGRINLSPPQCFITNNSLVLEIADSQTVLRDYLYYALQTVDRSKLVTGSAQPQVTINNAEILVIPLAPFPEQHRIVAEIEKQFTRLDAGVAALKRVQANLKRYRAAVLKAACEGKLVPTEAELRRTADYADIADKKVRPSASSAKSAVKTPPFETGEHLLQRILTERRSNWQGRGKYKEPVAIDTGELRSLPDGWTYASADQISSQITDGEHIQPKYTTEGFPMLSAKHVRNGVVVYNDVPLISEGDFQACLKRCAPTRDDILVVCVGATTGRAAIVGDAKPFAVVRSVLLIRTMIQPRFMLAWVQSPSCQTWIQSASGSSAQAHFYINNAKQMCVPLPPLAEQTRIVEEVERRLSVVDELEAVVSANLQRAARLRQSILQKAFTGGL
jgi:type I restriction enzyme S subunit